MVDESGRRSRPRHSVLIAARNESGFLRRTVEETLRFLPRGGLEVIVVDDASADGCTSFLEKDGHGDSRVRLIQNEERRGLIYSRARAADLATGEYLTFLDAHCSLAPSWLDQLRERLDRIDGRGIVTPAVLPLDPDTWSVDDGAFPATSGSIVNPLLDFGWVEPQLLDGELSSCAIGGMAWMCRRDWYHHLGGLDREMEPWGAENIDIALRTWVAGGRCIVDERIRVGHVFKSEFREALSPVDVALNKLRAAHTVFSRKTFERLLSSAMLSRAFREARDRLRAAPGRLDELKEHVESIRERCDHWIRETFRLPLCESLRFHSSPAGEGSAAGLQVQPGFVRTARRPLVGVVLRLEDDPDVDDESSLSSLLETTAYMNLHLLLIDERVSSSKDAKASRFQDHPRVRWLRAGSSPGRPSLDVAGSAPSEFEFLALLDARAVAVDQHWVEELLLLFEARPDLALVCPRTRWKTASGETIKESFERSWDWSASGFSRAREGEPLSERPYQAFSGSDTLVFLRRDAYLELGGFDASFHDLEDRVKDLAIRAWLRGYSVYCHPGVVFERSEPREPPPDAFPPIEWRKHYAQVATALKCFANTARLDACRRSSPRGEVLLSGNVERLSRERHRFLDRAIYEDDWLFYKFGVPDMPHD